MHMILSVIFTDSYYYAESVEMEGAYGYFRIT